MWLLSKKKGCPLERAHLKLYSLIIICHSGTCTKWYVVLDLRGSTPASLEPTWLQVEWHLFDRQLPEGSKLAPACATCSTCDQTRHCSHDQIATPWCLVLITVSADVRTLSPDFAPATSARRTDRDRRSPIRRARAIGFPFPREEPPPTGRPPTSRARAAEPCTHARTPAAALSFSASRRAS
jgi:hypothetical protein